jgi:hypothetical protein
MRYGQGRHSVSSFQIIRQGIGLEVAKVSESHMGHDQREPDWLTSIECGAAID